MFWFRAAVTVVLAAVICYTASYGVWEWKKRNRAGAIAVFALCIAAGALPVLA